jgi:hypothetical protein
MADSALHYTPLPGDVLPQSAAKNDAGTGGLKKKLPILIIGLLAVVALVLGVFYYINVFSVPTQKTANTIPTPQKSSITPSTAPNADEVNVFSNMEEQSLSCLDWQKYKARLDQIGQVCTSGCCPWVMDEDPGLGCSAPADGECKPKGNPCSDGTCWECRFEDERGFVLLRYVGNQWVSCSENEPTPTIPPISGCANPNQCLPMDQCETPPSTANPGNQCANNLYCCKPKTKITVTLTPPPVCTKPKVQVEVQCLQCEGEASTQ